jgi:hypothetical protein
MLGLLYDTEDREVRSRMDVEVLSQLTSGIHGILKPSGFRATLFCSISYPHGSCRKAQETPFLLTQSRTTLLACLELCNRFEQRHGNE